MEKIDFVLTWVDGSDPEWLKERAKYHPDAGADNSAARYRDWDNLQYLFRGIEQYAPWVNHVYFVTWGHTPKWLNLEHPKLRVIPHEEFMDPRYLPTFNINSIELNLHRIKGLSEQFVFFNDDMFLIRPVQPEDFFKKGLPRDCCIETALVQDRVDNPFAHILMNDAALVNMHYGKKEAIRRNFRKWFHPSYGSQVFRNVLMLPYQQFSSFKYTHQPSPFLKSTYELVWKEEGAVLDQVCRNRFRTVFDVNQYVMKYWQYMEGKYVPQSPKTGRFCIIGRHDEQIRRTLLGQECKTICLNDDVDVKDFEKEKRQVQEWFEKILPEKSSFEVSRG